MLTFLSKSFVRLQEKSWRWMKKECTLRGSMWSSAAPHLPDRTRPGLSSEEQQLIWCLISFSLLQYHPIDLYLCLQVSDSIPLCIVIGISRGRDFFCLFDPSQFCMVSILTCFHSFSLNWTHTGMRYNIYIV